MRDPAKAAGLPPLTADAIPLLMKGRWMVNIHHTLYASLVCDVVVVTPAGVPGPVALNESAAMPLEDFLSDYAAQRWVEFPSPS
jgi:hypothetical protein